MIKENNHNMENTIKNSKQNEGKELSEYSRELINDARDLMVGLFPDEKNIDNQITLNKIAINKELIRTCVVAILKDMAPEEKKKFKENPGDLKSILRLSAEKAQLSEEDKNSIKEKINSITLKDLISQSSITDKLDLLNLDSDVRRMGKALYQSFKENPEAVQSHAYMNLTER